jgi:hypothetical protein
MPTPQENLLFVEQAGKHVLEKGATSQQKIFQKGVDKLRGVCYSNKCRAKEMQRIELNADTGFKVFKAFLVPMM